MSTPQFTTVIDKAFLGRLCADAISNLERACEKHPEFPNQITAISKSYASDLLKRIRSVNDTGDATASLISDEELMELYIELINGNKKAAYNELVDLITVWLRVGLHLGDYVAKTEAGKVCPVDEEKCDRCAGVRDEPCPDAGTEDVTTKISKCPVCGQRPVVSHGDGPMNSVWCMGPDEKVHSRVGTGNHFEMLGAVCQWEAIVRDVLASNPSNPVEKEEAS